ncbi:NACHT, LRR and PYD domains-containing protein 1 homolog isoform X2 [Puntigrus tetrazona]|uniref:NACHT, LRR and PYD domains-containing protein 1 homolog isoform X2 n=1 Tax=Puntigrus tetrazona TaxID=1606681 RepID=UPI001C89B6A4|nr:NACHT, LRR and PYD domains-containing protein 1 homolog isoform X2 [Puntigrus tetrazona]
MGSSASSPVTEKEEPQLSRCDRLRSEKHNFLRGFSIDQGQRLRRRWTYENDASVFKGTVRQYKLSIKQKYESEWISLSGGRKSLSALYNQPVIIQEKENGRFENISLNDLLITCTKTVILRGDSGSGKSFIAQKIMFDWASEHLFDSHFYLVFYLRCEELVCISEEINLIELLSCGCSLTSDEISRILQQSPENVLFIIDGFEELRLTQDIYDMSTNIDPLEKALPGVILCGLIRGFLIPDSKLLVTTRTKNTVNKLLKGQPCLTEIMGFSERGVEISLQEIFSPEYDCMRANKAGLDVTKEPKTTTSIYGDFVSTLLKHHFQGQPPSILNLPIIGQLGEIGMLKHSQSQSVPTLLRSLGQLAERGMLEQQVLFDEKSVNKIISDPADKLFLYRLLSKRRIRQETMFSFMHHSFQELFTALYYVLLNEEKSQMKVKELLNTVERGWALSCWTDRHFSMADVGITRAKLLQPVILFLCSLCKKKLLPSFPELVNMAVSDNIETQLKEWINQYSQRYQSEHILFIFHCLYELHEKTFTRKVLDALVLIDMSNMPLKTIDCWVLKYCLQCCEHIRNLKLHVTPDNLKMLQPVLYLCKELWLTMEDISDNVVGLLSAAAEGKTLNKLNIKKLDNYGNRVGYLSGISVSVRDGDITLSIGTPVTELTVTSPRSFIAIVNWMKSQNFRSDKHTVKLLPFLKSFPDVKKVCLQKSVLTSSLAIEILSFIQACPSLTELSINDSGWIMWERTQFMETLEKMGWSLTVWGTLVLIKPCVERCTEEKLKTKLEKKTVPLEESSHSVSCSSLKDESSSSVPSQIWTISRRTAVQISTGLQSTKNSSEDAEAFAPELSGDKDKLKNTYRFMCEHAGQFRCSLTGLVFVMEGEGEVLYSVDSWDPCLLYCLGHMRPAGPLYNIDCSAKSVSQLHLPHCVIFSEENKEGLAVAHFTGGNVEIIPPLKVTETHAIIDIEDLSRFGLMWIKTKFGFPIDGQVLLFLRPVTIEQKQKILNVHLLPGNVPVSEVLPFKCIVPFVYFLNNKLSIFECMYYFFCIVTFFLFGSLHKVQHLHHNKSYIETSSKCSLFTDKEYSLCCQPEDCEVQPMSEIFHLDNFGPNYHPTFEVFLDVNIREVRLGVLDKTENGKVWHRRLMLPTAQSKGVEPPAHKMIPETEFVNTHGDKLIQRVSSAMPIADSLKSKNIITPEMWDNIDDAGTSQQKMRCLLKALESGGDSAKIEFCKLLMENEFALVNELAPHL